MAVLEDVFAGEALGAGLGAGLGVGLGMAVLGLSFYRLSEPSFDLLPNKPSRWG